MFGILVVSHDELATQLVKIATNIVGIPDLKICPVTIGWEQDLDDSRDRIATAIKEVSDTGEVIITTDMMGGTPTNVCLTFLERDNVELITGVNLPMVIKLVQLQGKGLNAHEAAVQASERAKDNIVIGSDKLYRV